MKLFCPLLFSLLIVACSTKPARPKIVANVKLPVHNFRASYATAKSPAIALKKDTAEIDQQQDAYADYYIVVADTGTNYYQLDKKMLGLKKSLGMVVDTMDRYYNKKKDLIALPDDYDDEIYAGDYAPRRYPSTSLSLEYMNFYRKGSKEKTIGLIAGIYENKTSADSALKTIALPGAFDLKSKVYVGCIH